MKIKFTMEISLMVASRSMVMMMVVINDLILLAIPCCLVCTCMNHILNIELAHIMCSLRMTMSVFMRFQGSNGPKNYIIALSVTNAPTSQKMKQIGGKMKKWQPNYFSQLLN